MVERSVLVAGMTRACRCSYEKPSGPVLFPRFILRIAVRSSSFDKVVGSHSTPSGSFSGNRSHAKRLGQHSTSQCIDDRPSRRFGYLLGDFGAVAGYFSAVSDRGKSRRREERAPLCLLPWHAKRNYPTRDESLSTSSLQNEKNCNRSHFHFI
jgi:hypothetical protein